MELAVAAIHLVVPFVYVLVNRPLRFSFTQLILFLALNHLVILVAAAPWLI